MALEIDARPGASSPAYVVKAEAEFPEVCDGILVFTDKSRIPSASTGVSKEGLPHGEGC